MAKERGTSKRMAEAVDKEDRAARKCARSSKKEKDAADALAKSAKALKDADKELGKEAAEEAGALARMLKLAGCAKSLIQTAKTAGHTIRGDVPAMPSPSAPVLLELL